MKNIAYAGALVALLDIDMELVAELLGRDLRAQRARCAESNQTRAAPRLRLRDRALRVPAAVPRRAAWTPTASTILIDGNTATALGCLYAGATVAAWYPITPATAVMDNFTRLCAQYRREPSREPTELRHIEQLPDPAGRGRDRRDRHGARRRLERRAGLHLDLGPGDLADERAARPRVLHRDPRGDHRRAAHRAVDRHADAHPAGRHPDLRLRPPRRHQAHPAVPGEPAPSASSSRSQSFDLAERFQTPVFMLSDLDIGMNDWVVPELHVGRRLRARPRPGARRRGPATAWPSSSATPTTTPTTWPPRTLPGSDEKGAYFIRGSGHDTYGALHREPRGVPGGRRPPEAQARRRGRPRARARSSSAARAPRSASSPSAAATSRCARRSTCSARRASPRTTCACAASPSSRRSRASSTSTRTASSSSRTATPSCARCIAIETGVAIEDELRSVLAYGGFPLSAKHVVDARPRSQLEKLTMPSITKPLIPLAPLREERARPDHPRLRGRDVDAVRGLRPRLGHRRDHPRASGSSRPRRT